jgi:hypothetical protein
MESTTEQLTVILSRKYNALDEKGVVAISPADLASAAYSEIDPLGRAPWLVQIAAIAELRQLARAVCRTRHLESERTSEQGSLFDFQLQPRYPAKRPLVDGETPEDVYVLREHLTKNERDKNILRLRREAEAKTVHADALQAETDYLIQAGRLSEESVAG